MTRLRLLLRDLLRRVTRYDRGWVDGYAAGRRAHLRTLFPKASDEVLDDAVSWLDKARARGQM